MILKLLSNFRKDDKGGILAFYLIMFITLMIGGGMSVDFMNSEYQREKIQDALDRGVLAATAIGKAAEAVTPTELAQAEADAILIVKSYLQGAGYDPEAPGVAINPEFTFNVQRVAATADYQVDTFFLRLSGINTLGGNATAGAIISQRNVEISLVLDVSNSMNFDGGGKIADLRTAGANFVGNMLAGNRRQFTFISVLPFNHSVNMGSDILGRFSSQKWHDYNGCASFESAEYSRTAISPNSGLEQVGHLVNSAKAPGKENYLCDGGEAIVYSNNATDLENYIGSLSAVGDTAGYIGIKWAMGLLDPSAQPIVSDLISDGLAPPEMAGRPAAFFDDSTLKFIIFMSDGAMNSTYRFDPLQHGIYPGYAQVTDGDGNLLPANSVENADYWEANPDIGVWYEQLSPSGPSPLLTACSTAKAQGISVFSIAYDVTPGSPEDQVLEDCATNSDQYYSVETDNLDAAFSLIEATIQRLKLTN